MTGITTAPFPLGDGIAARIVECGGDAILWLHGYTLDASSFGELWSLLPGWSHLGVDLPGHGASRPFEAGEDLPSLARRLGRLAIERGVRHLIALSFGTIIATQIAVEYPTSFASLVLAAPSLAGGPQDASVGQLYEELGRLYQERGPGPHLRSRWIRSPPGLFKGAARRPELQRSLEALVDRHGWAELGDGTLKRLLAHPQSEADLRRIQAATLILLGEEEFPAFRRCGEIIRRAVPGAKRIYLEGVGHLCLLEAPLQVQGPIERHLREHASALAGGSTGWLSRSSS